MQSLFHNSDLMSKSREIFEVKINQQKLCSFMESLSIKIHHLQQGLRSVNTAISKNNIMDELRIYTKHCVTEQTTKNYTKLVQKFDNYSRQVIKMNSSFHNSEKLLRNEIDSLREKQRLIEKSVAFLISHEISEINQRITQLNQLHKANTIQNTDIFKELKEKDEEILGKYDVIQQKFLNLDEKTVNLQKVVKEIHKKMDEERRDDDLRKGNQTQHLSNFSHKIPKGAVRKSFAIGQLQKSSFDIIKQGQQNQSDHIQANHQSKTRFPLRKKDSLQRNSGISQNRSQYTQQMKEKQNAFEQLQKYESSCNLLPKSKAKKENVRKSAVFHSQDFLIILFLGYFISPQLLLNLPIHSNNHINM